MFWPSKKGSWSGSSHWGKIFRKCALEGNVSVLRSHVLRMNNGIPGRVDPDGRHAPHHQGCCSSGDSPGLSSLIPCKVKKIWFFGPPPISPRIAALHTVLACPPFSWTRPHIDPRQCLKKINLPALSGILRDWYRSWGAFPHVQCIGRPSVKQIIVEGNCLSLQWLYPENAVQSRKEKPETKQGYYSICWLHEHGCSWSRWNQRGNHAHSVSFLGNRRKCS